MASPPKSAEPLDLLKEIRAAFKYDAAKLREQQEQTVHPVAKLEYGIRAQVCEGVVHRIDATLRDWA